MIKEKLIIAVDFDGTCVTHEYPNIGKDIGAVSVLKKLVENGHQLMLWTMRCHPHHNHERDCLKEAIKWFEKNEIPLWSVNSNPTQRSWTNSYKQYAQLYIDDAALGCPLKYDYIDVPTETEVEQKVFGDTKKIVNGKPYVDWKKVEEMLIEKGLI